MILKTWIPETQRQIPDIEHAEPSCFRATPRDNAPPITGVVSVPETRPDRREQGGWQRDNTLLTGLGRMIGACNISNR